MSARGLADTSVFIAAESGRPLKEELLPREVAVSVVTLAELHAGALAADSIQVRAKRLATVQSLSDVLVLPIDEQIALIWGQMRVELSHLGRRLNVNDLWIAATAARHHMPVYTQDNDFAPVEGMNGLSVVRV